MRRKIGIWLAVIVVAVAGSVIVLRRRQTQAATTYQTAPATKGTVTATVSGNGNVVVDQSAKVTPAVSGMVGSIAVKLGDQVKKGQTLFTIQNDSLQVAADKAYASYLQTKQAVSAAQATQSNAQAAVDNPPANANTTTLGFQLDAANAGLTAAQQNQMVAWSDYQNQKNQALSRTVTSPIDGTITTLNISAGDQISPSGNASASSSGSSSSTSSSNSAMIIEDLGSLKASIQINEVDAPKVKTGQKVSMTFDAIDGLTATGKIEKIDTAGTVSQGVVSYMATIDFDSVDGRIRPGMSVTTTVTTDVKQDVLTVPSSAVKSDAAGQYVQILKNGNPTRQTVETGLVGDTTTEITSGLQENDQVVTRTVNPSASPSPTARSGLSIPGLSG